MQKSCKHSAVRTISIFDNLPFLFCHSRNMTNLQRCTMHHTLAWCTFSAHWLRLLTCSFNPGNNLCQVSICHLCHGLENWPWRQRWWQWSRVGCWLLGPQHCWRKAPSTQEGCTALSCNTSSGRKGSRRRGRSSCFLLQLFILLLLFHLQCLLPLGKWQEVSFKHKLVSTKWGITLFSFSTFILFTRYAAQPRKLSTSHKDVSPACCPHCTTTWPMTCCSSLSFPPRLLTFFTALAHSSCVVPHWPCNGSLWDTDLRLGVWSHRYPEGFL